MPVTLRPVTELRRTGPFTAWPLAEADPPDTLAISGRLTFAEVSWVMATLADVHADDDAPAEADADLVVTHLLCQDTLVMWGGLTLDDSSTGVTIAPGCCCGVEDWREWAGALGGESPWLGHDPSPWIELDGDRLRVWQDEGFGDQSASGAQPAFVDLPVAAFPELLRSAHHDLRGFLARVGEWADVVAPALSADLVRGLDDALGVSAPLEIVPPR